MAAQVSASSLLALTWPQLHGATRLGANNASLQPEGAGLPMRD